MKTGFAVLFVVATIALSPQAVLAGSTNSAKYLRSVSATPESPIAFPSPSGYLPASGTRPLSRTPSRSSMENLRRLSSSYVSLAGAAAAAGSGSGAPTGSGSAEGGAANAAAAAASSVPHAESCESLRSYGVACQAPVAVPTGSSPLSPAMPVGGLDRIGSNSALAYMTEWTANTPRRDRALRHHRHRPFRAHPYASPSVQQYSATVQQREPIQSMSMMPIVQESAAMGSPFLHRGSPSAALPSSARSQTSVGVFALEDLDDEDSDSGVSAEAMDAEAVERRDSASELVDALMDEVVMEEEQDMDPKLEQVPGQAVPTPLYPPELQASLFQVELVARNVLMHMQQSAYSQQERQLVAANMNILARINPSLDDLQAVFQKLEADPALTMQRLMVIKNMMTSFLTYYHALNALTMQGSFVGVDVWQMHLSVPSVTLSFASMAMVHRVIADLTALISIKETKKQQVFRNMRPLMRSRSGLAGAEDAAIGGVIEDLNVAASSAQDVVKPATTYHMSVDILNGVSSVFMVLDKVAPPVRDALARNRMPISITVSAASIALQLMDAASAHSSSSDEFSIALSIMVRAADILEHLRGVDFSAAHSGK